MVSYPPQEPKAHSTTTTTTRLLTPRLRADHYLHVPNVCRNLIPYHRVYPDRIYLTSLFSRLHTYIYHPSSERLETALLGLTTAQAFACCASLAESSNTERLLLLSDWASPTGSPICCCQNDERHDRPSEWATSRTLWRELWHRPGVAASESPVAYYLVCEFCSRRSRWRAWASSKADPRHLAAR